MKKKIPLIFFLVVCLNLQSQELPNIFPPNPEVAALGKYGDIPVSHSTGVANIQIPITSLSSSSLNIPISLGYNSSGIRVNEIASNVGLGWTLNAGGAISRSVRGLPDDYGQGYLDSPITPEAFSQLSSFEDKESYNLGYALDLESDIYYISFMGYNTKFHFSSEGEIITNPKSDLIIKYYKDQSKIIGWIIHTPDGTKFYFGSSKDSNRTAFDKSTFNVTNGTTFPDPSPYLDSYITSWKLLDVETSGEKLTSFNYETTSVSFWNFLGQTKEIPTGNGTSNNTLRNSFGYNEDVVNRITSISNGNGSILFEYNMERQDLNYNHALTNIILEDLFSNTIDSFELAYDYFISTNNNHNSNYGDLNQRRKRLYLKSVTQKLNNTENKTYKFEYYDTQILPDRFSFSTDFWGYYNGEINSVWYPTLNYFIGQQSIEIPGANRKTKSSFSKACSLKKITYPTGGHTEFEFESNTVGNIDFFGLTEYEKVPIDGITSVNSNQTEMQKDVIVSDPSEYEAIEWIIRFPSCENDPQGSGQGIDCPQGRVYKKINGQYELIGVSDGSGTISGFILYDKVADPPVPIELSLEFTNYSGTLDSPRVDISVLLAGYINIADSKNSHLAGGLRIKELKNFDSNGSLLNLTKYKYNKFDSELVSSGAALNPPTYLKTGVPYPGSDPVGATSMLLESNSIFPLTSGAGSVVNYTNITELVNGENNGKVEYTYTFTHDGIGAQGNLNYYIRDLTNGTKTVAGNQSNAITPFEDFSHRRGKLKNKRIFKKTDSGFLLQREIDNTYTPNFDNTVRSKNVITINNSFFQRFLEYTNVGERYFQTGQKISDFNDTGDVIVFTTYEYDPVGYEGRSFPISKTTINSEGQTILEKSYFPDDILNNTSLPNGALDNDNYHAISNLKSSNSSPRSGALIQKNITIDGELVSSHRNNFLTFNTNNLIFKSSSQSLKGVFSSSNRLENRVLYHEYDEFGNPLEISKADGMPMVYIWGYNKSYPIAIIENVTLADVNAYISYIQQLSNQDNDRTYEYLGNEGALRQALDNLRTSLPQAMISTYTYDPLIGVTSMTDSRGYTVYYEYDIFNRLMRILDADGYILKEYAYKYGDGLSGEDGTGPDTDPVTDPERINIEVTHQYLSNSSEGYHYQIIYNATDGSGNYEYRYATRYGTPPSGVTGEWSTTNSFNATVTCENFNRTIYYLIEAKDLVSGDVASYSGSLSALCSTTKEGNGDTGGGGSGGDGPSTIDQK